MKKIFLVFGIAGFSAAAAQQRELFDIENHLKKKSFEKKNKPYILPLKIQHSILPNTLMLSHTYTLANGDKVYTSPAYNMPVIKPDMTPFSIMPTIGRSQQVPIVLKRSNPGTIPNGSAPLVFQK